MNIYTDQIDRMVWEQKMLLENHTRELGDCPEGSMWRCLNHGKENYYHIHEEGGRYVRSSINRKPEIINALARKEYLSVTINVLKNNISILESAEKKLDSYDFDRLKTQMPKAYQKLPEECFFLTGTGQRSIYSFEGAEEWIKRHKKWASEPYEKSTYNPEGRRHMTSAGFKVRSKSEQHIVEQLVNYGVPFRYEQVLHFNDSFLVPDFTFRNGRLKLFYWEHAGMMNDPIYCARHKKKMQLMDRNGIVPWENLIITYDINDSINVPMIKCIIENDVIPRL